MTRRDPPPRGTASIISPTKRGLPWREVRPRSSATRDTELERELRYLYATREETFLHGSRQALLNHTERVLQVEREYARRVPERTKADALRTRKGSRIQAGQPTGR
jgi:hypothetical protein